MLATHLIVGLGNIGEEYQFTRHNIGFEVINKLLEKFSAEKKYDSLGVYSVFRIKNKMVMCLKPSTYMNLSGKAVKSFLNRNKIPKDNCLIITDDFAIDFGTIRLRTKGSHGGHNGLRSIEDYLQTQEYNRLRIGIGNNFEKKDQINYVLGKWSSHESENLKPIFTKSVEAIETFVLEGMEQSMNKHNGKIF